MRWQLRLPDRVLVRDEPVVMGVLNVTPDSFSDGGRWTDVDVALAGALAMVRDGATIIDIGGESTRPGAAPVSEAEELDRVLPVIRALRAASEVVISVDTMKPAVMRAACAAGAELVNDVMALRADGALAAVRDANAAVCLMHMQGAPRTMQDAPRYGDVVAEVQAFLEQRLRACVDAGMSRQRCCIDPGIGFGKTLAHNIALLRGLDALTEIGVPVLVGVSNKSLIGQLTGRPVERRWAGSLAAAALAVSRGAAIVRSHDVAGTLDALRVASALSPERTAQ